MAAAKGHTSMAELLVLNGADLFYFDSDGHSALQLAQMNGHYSCAHQLILAIEQLNRDAENKYKVDITWIYQIRHKINALINKSKAYQKSDMQTRVY